MQDGQKQGSLYVQTNPYFEPSRFRFKRININRGWSIDTSFNTTFATSSLGLQTNWAIRKLFESRLGKGSFKFDSDPKRTEFEHQFQACLITEPNLNMTVLMRLANVEYVDISYEFHI